MAVEKNITPKIEIWWEEYQVGKMGRGRIPSCRELYTHLCEGVGAVEFGKGGCRGRVREFGRGGGG